jgi:glycosyltransferase involved in cell wall biosynthesis
MNLILLSTDTNLLREGSVARTRLSGYGVLADRVDIVLFAGAMAPGVREIGERVFVHAISGIKPVAAIRAVRAIKKLARTASDGCVLSVQDPFELGLIGLAASKFARVPLHVQIHIDFFNTRFVTESLRQRLQAFIAPFVLRRADRIRAVSRRIRDYVVDTMGIDADIVDCVPVVSIVPEAERAIGTREDRAAGDTPLVLMMSRLVKQKRVPSGIHAFAAARAQCPGLRLRIIGDGPEAASVQKAIDSHPECADAIEVRSWTDAPAAEMASCDVFMLPSGYEGWGMTAIEAAAQGAAIVMTDVGCAGEALRDDVECLVVPVGDQAALTAALVRLATDGGLRRRLGAAAALRGTEFIDVAHNHRMLADSVRSTRKRD